MSSSVADEPTTNRLVAVKKVDSAIQLWSKMQIADADKLSRINSNVEFQRSPPSKELACNNQTTKIHACPPVCETLMAYWTGDRSLCSDITASLMQHLLLVMRLQSELGQELHEARQAHVQQDKMHTKALAQLEDTNAQLREELKDSGAEVQVQRELAQQLDRQIREQQERAQEQLLRADARLTTAQNEMMQELRCAEVRMTQRRGKPARAAQWPPARVPVPARLLCSQRLRALLSAPCAACPRRKLT